MRGRRQCEWAFYRELGVNIAAVRRARSLTRCELAERTDSRLQSIHYWEKGERGISAAKLQLVADALGVTVTSLIGDAACVLASDRP
jgi:transcriptional regulator with XRE-family HTH domain